MLRLSATELAADIAMLEPFLARPSQQAKATVSVPAGARSEYSENESEIGFQRALSAGPTALARPRWPERSRPVLAEGDKFSQGTGRRVLVESRAKQRLRTARAGYSDATRRSP